MKKLFILVSLAIVLFSCEKEPLYKCELHIKGEVTFDSTNVAVKTIKVGIMENAQERFEYYNNGDIVQWVNKHKNVYVSLYNGGKMVEGTLFINGEQFDNRRDTARIVLLGEVN